MEPFNIVFTDLLPYVSVLTRLPVREATNHAANMVIAKGRVGILPHCRQITPPNTKSKMA